MFKFTQTQLALALKRIEATESCSYERVGGNQERERFAFSIHCWPYLGGDILHSQPE